MSGAPSIFCSTRVGAERCHKIAWHRCFKCSRMLCRQHAIRVPTFGGTRWSCVDCQRKTVPYKRLSESVI